MTHPIAPDVIAKIREHGFRVMPDIYCPTWQYESHKGWRGVLIHWLRFPKRWFKPEKRHRVMYWITTQKTLVCSHENCALIMKAMEGGA